MKGEKRIQIQNAAQWKKTFDVPNLIIGLFLSTYILSVSLIEFSLSFYVINENKIELYRDYLLFKNGSGIWKIWQIIVMFVVPISIYDCVLSLIQIFTKHATWKRNVLDILKAIQLCSILSITVIFVMPLEKRIASSITQHLIEELNFYSFFTFFLNILGCILNLLYYRESKTIVSVATDKKIN